MRLIVVSNRLPVTLRAEGDEIISSHSAGGVSSALSSCIARFKAAGADVIWVGWPGGEIPARSRAKATDALHERGAMPVYLPQRVSDRFYAGFCNKTLWPLFHYSPAIVTYDEREYEAYVAVNERFAEAISRIARPGDTVWVHDYHLLLLPQMLRERHPELSIGLFLHIPFPACELFQHLPRAWGERILEGMLGADLVGFQTHGDNSHFLRCTTRLLGLENKMGVILLKDRIVKADTFPIGIDFAQHQDAAATPSAAQLQQRLGADLHGKRILLSVDRLDYTKGIPERLLAYELFLKQYPQWREKVVMVMVVTPSRTSIPQYARMQKRLEEMVGHINGQFATIGWAPIIYQSRVLEPAELSAYYALSDVALVTPLRDGMNLIAKEYLASKSDERGVLILSSMAGAAQELGEALIVNPNDVHGCAEAINEAFSMPVEEQQRRNAILRKRLQRYDVVRWAEEFLAATGRSHAAQHALRERILSADDRETLVRAFQHAKDRLILLDYDGTLIEFAPAPEQAKPDGALLELLRRLGAEATVVIVSGRDRATLEAWFGTLPLWLVAEHGATMKINGVWAQADALDTSWKPQLLPLLERHVDRLPGSFIEHKEFALAFHYRVADPELSSTRTRELLDDLTSFTAGIDVQVLQGNKVIEVRCSGINKGRAAQRLASGQDFILAIGDDRTDEDLFRALPDAHSLRVGMGSSHARYNIPSVKDVRAFLSDLLAIGKREEQSPPTPASSHKNTAGRDDAPLPSSSS